MESGNTDVAKDSRKGESVMQYAIESRAPNGESMVLKRCRRKLKPEKTLILNVRRSRASARIRECFLQNIHGFNIRIPKHITTLDEKYALHCLEMIRNFALRAAAWNFTSNSDNLPDDMSNNLAMIESRSPENVTNLAFEYPVVGKNNVIMNSYADWTIGTLSGSQTMLNIMNSPLLQQFGVRKSGLLENKEPFHSGFMDSLQESSSTSSLQKEVNDLDHKYVSAAVHKRDASKSSTNSSCSDQSSSASSSFYGTSFQGTLQCKWKNGLPHLSFTVDDKGEVYIASLSKVESSDGKGSDYVYTFHSNNNGKKECGVVNELELESIAKMLVYTSITFSSNNSEIRETRFILSVSSDNHTEEIGTSNHTVTKNKKLTSKVVDIFRSTHSYKQRSSSKSALPEETQWDPSENMHSNRFDLGEYSAENKYAPNFELAAIIVKDVCTDRKEKEAGLGGWGLKFLKKPSLESSKSSECARNTGECSTSMDVIIPAGFHGGTGTRVGGPSSLTERWISGGHCDCGGWDIGCPLTILKSRSSNTDYSSPEDNSNSREGCSVGLFTQGSKQNGPIMKLVNFHEGLYYVNFQPTLSSLQCFAIASAIIHSHSLVRRSKGYRKLK